MSLSGSIIEYKELNDLFPGHQFNVFRELLTRTNQIEYTLYVRKDGSTVKKSNATVDLFEAQDISPREVIQRLIDNLEDVDARD